MCAAADRWSDIQRDLGCTSTYILAKACRRHVGFDTKAATRRPFLSARNLHDCKIAWRPGKLCFQTRAWSTLTDWYSKLLQSLCNRKPFPAEYSAPSLCSQSPSLDFVLDLAFRLSPLLASADLIVARVIDETANHKNAVHDLARVVRDLFALEKMLDSWLKTFCEPTEAPEADNASSPHRWEKRRALPNVTSESLCLICILLIHQALSDLHSSHNSDIPTQRHAQQLAAECAEDLYKTTLLLSEIAERPVSKAIATRAPLHFLCRYYQSVGDTTRLERCYEMIEGIRREAPYLNWDMLLPWSLLPLTSVRGAGGPLTAHLSTTPSSDNSAMDIVSQS